MSSKHYQGYNPFTTQQQQQQQTNNPYLNDPNLQAAMQTYNPFVNQQYAQANKNKELLQQQQQQPAHKRSQSMEQTQQSQPAQQMVFSHHCQNNMNGNWTEYDIKLKTMNAEIQKLSQLNKQKDEQIKSLNDKVTQLLEDNKENNTYNDNDIMTQMRKMTQRMEEMNAKIVALDKDNKTLSKQEKLKLFLDKSVFIYWKVSKYYNLFIENGLESVESLFNLTTEDLKEMGISKWFDRKQIFASIQTEKNKNKQANYEGNTTYM
eukprot:232126_1